MDSEVIQQIITGLPNFAGFTFAILALLYVIRSNNRTIADLIEKWSDCEDDQERGNLQKIGD